MSLWSIIFVITFGGEICTYRRMPFQFERMQYVWNYASLLNHEQNANNMLVMENWQLFCELSGCSKFKLVSYCGLPMKNHLIIA